MHEMYSNSLISAESDNVASLRLHNGLQAEALGSSFPQLLSQGFGSEHPDSSINT